MTDAAKVPDYEFFGLAQDRVRGRVEQEARWLMILHEPGRATPEFRWEVRVAESDEQRQGGDRLRIIGRGATLEAAAEDVEQKWEATNAEQ